MEKTQDEKIVVGTPSDLPIWARLAFNEMVPETYFFLDGDKTVSRHPKDAVITGFCRTGDQIEIYYEMDWPDKDLGPITHLYCWLTTKK